MTDSGGSPEAGGGMRHAGGQGTSVWAGGDGAFGESEPVLVPVCKTGDWWTPSAARALATAMVSYNNRINVLTFDREVSTVLSRVSESFAPGAWSAWMCFDVVPDVTHLAAMNLSGGQIEILALSGSR